MEHQPVRKYEDNPFEDPTIAEEWVASLEKDDESFREKEIHPMLTAWVHEISPRTLVDIGAGEGGSVDYAQFGDIRYIGIEPSAYLVAQAQERRAKAGREFVAGNAYDLPIQDAGADAAFSINVWFHIKDLNAAAKELARILCLNGHFLICTANPEAYDDSWLPMFEDARVDEKTIDGKLNIPGNSLSRNLFFKHTMQEMLEAFAANGLVIDRTEMSGILENKKPFFINFFGHKT